MQKLMILLNTKWFYDASNVCLRFVLAQPIEVDVKVLIALLAHTCHFPALSSLDFEALRRRMLKPVLQRMNPRATQ